MYRLVFISVLAFNCAFSQTFTVTTGPSLDEDRVMHSAAELNNGKLMVIGGNNGYFSDLTYLNSCTYYNPITNSFEPAPAMIEARDNFMTAVLNSGDVLVVGGNNKIKNGILECEIFSLSLNKWIATDSLQMSHSYGASVKLLDGRVLVAGGMNAKSEAFDPYKKEWNFVGDMNLLHGMGMSLTLLSDGNVLAIGGDQNANTLEVFSPITNSWTELLVHTSLRKIFHSSILLKDGKVLIIGSNYPEKEAQISSEIFDPINRTVTSTGNLLSNSVEDDIVLLDNGHVLTYGIGDVGNFQNTKCFQEFNPSTGSWTSGIYNNIGAHEYTINKLANGKVIIMGGNNAIGSGVSKSTILIDQNGYQNCTPPSLNSIISTEINEDCYGKSQTISINNSQLNTTYSVVSGGNKIKSISGNGSLLKVEIPANNITLGANTLNVIVAKAGCPELKMQNNVTLKVTQTNTTSSLISLIEGTNFLCAKLYSATYQVNTPLSGQYIWYDGSVGSKLVVGDPALVFVRHLDSKGCLGPKSNIEIVKNTKLNDLQVGPLTTVCEGSLVQLSAIPPGGIWSGRDVTPEGTASPSYNNRIPSIVSYEYCDFYVPKELLVEPTNKITYNAKDIDWTFTKDTICGSAPFPILLRNINKAYNVDFLINDTVKSSLEYDKDFFLNYYTPTLSPSVKLSFKFRTRWKSSHCEADSLIISKTFQIMPVPVYGTKVIIPDTVCFNSPVVVKIVKPVKGLIYYSTFFTGSNISAPKVFHKW
ncbi:MAG: hypothetical protein H7329_05290 [Opitutaceae bacterium]|nr:hypothetical protein [Cytophagales bacterium]